MEMKDETLQRMTILMAIEYNVEITEKLMLWVSEACVYASAKPDEEYARKDSKNNEEQIRWMIFLETVKMKVGMKIALYDKKDSSDAEVIQERGEYKIHSLKARLYPL